MRGAWGKPYGTVARVNIGQIILSIRCKEANAPVIMEALRRARYKFPGRQKIIVSKKWGFTNVNKEQYQALKAEGRVLQYVLLPFFSDLPLTDVQGWCLRTVHPAQGPACAEPQEPAPCSVECVDARSFLYMHPHCIIYVMTSARRFIE